MTTPWNGLPVQYADKYSRHILIEKTSGSEEEYEWCPDDQEWSAMGSITILKAKNIAKHYAYGWPVMIQMSPSELAQMRKDERERCAGIADKVSLHYDNLAEHDAKDEELLKYCNRSIAVSECAGFIRALTDDERKKS